MIYIHIEQAISCKASGGVNSVITDLSEEMAQEGYDVHVVSLQQHSNIDFNDQIEWGKKKNISVAIMQKKNESVFQQFFNLRRYIKQLNKKDKVCLFMHLKWGVLAGVVSTLGLRNVCRVEVYHSGYMNYKLQSTLCKCFIKHHIAVSKEAKEQLIQQFHVKQSKITVVYNGVDVAGIRIKAKSFKPMQLTGLRFISVGRLTFEKGFLDSISAFTNIKIKGDIPESQYYMIGDGQQRKEATEISKGAVMFTGRIPREKVFEYIANSSCVILPSLWEGNSILLLEVLSIGKPVLVTDIPSFREVLNFAPLEDNEEFRICDFGIVFRKESPSSCEMAIRSFCSLDKIERDSMSQIIYKIADNYSLTKQAHEYVNIANGLSNLKN